MDSPQENSLQSQTVDASSRSVGAQPIFFGPHGLRAGWRLLIYGCLYYALRTIIFVITGLLFTGARGRVPPLWGFLVSECTLAAIALLPALLLSRLEKRAFGDYGLPARKAFRKNFWVGAAWGFVAVTALILSIDGLGALSFGGLALHGIRVMKFAVFWAVFFLVVALYEEFFARGYTQFTLGQGIGFWPAAVLLSAGFGAIHLNNPGEGWTGALGAACIGLFFAFTLRRTGNLWFAMGMHMSWDWSETYFYSVPDSGLVLPGHLLNASLHGPRWLTGGSVGPEGSVLLFVLIAAMWVVFDRVYRPVLALPQASGEENGS
ncbi:MAG TPA: CPBP family intramembrane glutamic endopeptidase [Terriglobales bacterium]|nr:CPBP family intramembrane glutamic endopeptidase [Terriglobales bacterium]